MIVFKVEYYDQFVLGWLADNTLSILFKLNFFSAQ